MMQLFSLINSSEDSQRKPISSTSLSLALLHVEVRFPSFSAQNGWVRKLQYGQWLITCHFRGHFSLTKSPASHYHSSRRHSSVPCHEQTQWTKLTGFWSIRMHMLLLNMQPFNYEGKNNKTPFFFQWKAQHTKTYWEGGCMWKLMSTTDEQHPLPGCVKKGVRRYVYLSEAWLLTDNNLQRFGRTGTRCWDLGLVHVMFKESSTLWLMNIINTTSRFFFSSPSDYIWRPSFNCLLYTVLRVLHSFII